jgi:hypothetical protein
MVVDYMTNFLVMGDLAYPRQIWCGQSYVANLRPNQMVLNQNQPNPVWCFTWAVPNNVAMTHGPSPTFQPFFLFSTNTFCIIYFWFQPFCIGPQSSISNSFTSNENFKITANNADITNREHMKLHSSSSHNQYTKIRRKISCCHS